MNFPCFTNVSISSTCFANSNVTSLLLPPTSTYSGLVPATYKECIPGPPSFFPTEQPTLAPTAFPTIAPTTATPTSTPSSQPTSMPSVPTSVPTKNPTEAPTVKAAGETSSLGATSETLTLYAAGGSAGAFCCCWFLVICWRRRKRKDHESEEDEANPMHKLDGATPYERWMNHADKKKTEAEEGDFTLDDTVNPMQNSMQMTAAGDYDEESAMSTLPTGENPMDLGLGASGALSTITSIYATALHDHKAEGDTELTIEAGETLEVIKQVGKWWYGRSLSCFGSHARRETVRRRERRGQSTVPALYIAVAGSTGHLPHDSCRR